MTETPIELLERLEKLPQRKLRAGAEVTVYRVKGTPWVIKRCDNPQCLRDLEQYQRVALALPEFFPTTYVIPSKGVIIQRYIGSRPKLHLNEEIAAQEALHKEFEEEGFRNYDMHFGNYKLLPSGEMRFIDLGGIMPLSSKFVTGADTIAAAEQKLAERMVAEETSKSMRKLLRRVRA